MRTDIIQKKVRRNTLFAYIQKGVFQPSSQSRYQNQQMLKCVQNAVAFTYHVHIAVFTCYMNVVICILHTCGIYIQPVPTLLYTFSHL
jgi:hypothetical protein